LPDFDAIVAGGSVGGLSFAAEAARRGLEVLVLEEHEEVGEPEKCDGLVSMRGLRRYGLAPSTHTVQSVVHEGVVHAPSGGGLTVRAEALEVVVIDRSLYDKELATKASNWGAGIKTGARVQDARKSDDRVKVLADKVYECSYFVDARGPGSSQRGGIIPAAKYEVEGEWVREGTVEVFLDQERYPGFFAWVIPFGEGRAKVGAAGHGVNPSRALESFLDKRSHRVVRKVAAPIYVGGPAEEFISGRTLYVGESAGQVKPTTAGGISTSIAGGVIAARWLADSIVSHDPSLLSNYRTDWMSRFEKEIRIMMKLRGIFESLTNKDMDLLVSSLSSPRLLSRLSRSDFDFHASALLSSLGVIGLLKITRLLGSVQVKQLLSRAA